jgi:hypothetical protein
VWSEDGVVLPAGGGDRVYRNLFTGDIVEPWTPTVAVMLPKVRR